MPFARPIAVLAFVLALSACESSEERAEGHYQSALSLMEDGEVERALVELRNVFDLNGNHREARSLYAATVLAQGNVREAYGQYLRLVEQYPNDAEGRIVLSELAFQSGNWTEFERHSEVAKRVAADDGRVQVLGALATYRQALLDEDSEARTRAQAQAVQLAEANPGNPMLQRIVIDAYLQDGRFTDALREIDRALETEPDNRLYYNQKLGVLTQLGDYEGIEAELQDMIERFPEDGSLIETLLRVYMSRGKLDETEAFLREVSSPADEDQKLYLTLIRFLVEQRGTEAALSELQAAIDSGVNSLPLRGLKASIDFQEGRRDQAIADLEGLIDGAEPSSELNGVRVMLAQMLASTGNEVGARRLIEETLAADPSQVDGLKMQASWQITGDEPDAAIATLRRALDQNPEDSQAMMLMAEAYSRTGSHDLARDFLSLAVEASGNAPATSIRYARLLREDERLLPAEDTLVTALRAAPGNLELLLELGQLYLQMEDQARTEQVISTLRRQETPAAKTAADALEVGLLEQRGGITEALSFIENIAREEGNLGATVAIVRARLVSGDAQGALDYIRDAVTQTPDDDVLRYLMHTAEFANGLYQAAEEGYRRLLEKNPGREQLWLQLAQTVGAQGRREEAYAVLDEALAAVPDGPNLLWSKASVLERQQDFEGAIEIYERMYKNMSGSLVVANNLASLISTYRTDAESLDRAFNVARRLRGTDVPAFQDTYGWIMYRRGNYNEALEYLEPAAEALQGDALVQYHLAKTYAALGRMDEALTQFRRAVQIAGQIDSRPQIEEARAEVRRLAMQDGATDDSGASDN